MAIEQLPIWFFYVWPLLLIWSFIGLYSLFRFFTEFFKELPVGYGTGFFDLNVAQWVSLIGMGLAIYYLIKLRKN